MPDIKKDYDGLIIIKFDNYQPVTKKKKSVQYKLPNEGFVRAKYIAVLPPIECPINVHFSSF